MLRGCLRRNWPDQLSRGISEPRVARMPWAKLAGPPQLRAYRSPELQGCLRRNWPDNLARGIPEPNAWRKSQTKLAGSPKVRAYRSPARIARMSHAKLNGQPRVRHIGAQSCEDVSGEIGCTTSHAASRSLDLRGRRKRSWPDHVSRGRRKRN